jgi:hypothetical protein
MQIELLIMQIELLKNSKPGTSRLLNSYRSKLHRPHKNYPNVVYNMGWPKIKLT